MKLITVIIPVYNVEEYLSRCVNSVINQSYKKLEIILVDDGSDDSSLSICKAFSMKDNRIQVYHTKNLGLSHARNVGLNHANGEYVVFVDSDDYVNKNMIGTMLDKADNADLVICNYEKVPNDSTKKLIQDEKCLKDEKWNAKQFWYHYYDDLRVFCCVAWNKLYKRELFVGVRYPLNKIHEDEYIINSVISRCTTIKVITDSLYYYVQRPNSIMHSLYQGYFENAEAFLSRCNSFRKYNYVNIQKKNFNEIPVLLVSGLEETKGKKDSKKIYYKLRKEYILYLRKYLREKFSMKLYIKRWLLMTPHLYSLYIKIKR